MYKKPGKRINVKKTTAQTPGAEEFYKLAQINKINKKTNKIQTHSVLATGLPLDGTIRAGTGINSSDTEPFKVWLIKNCAATTTTTIRVGAITSIPISEPENTGGKSYTIRSGDLFFVYDRETFRCTEFIATADLLKDDTAISVISTTIRQCENISAGSYVMPDYNLITQRAADSILYKEFALTNGEYTSLYSSGFILLAGATDTLHMPISCFITYNHNGDDEGTNTDLYIGYLSPSETIGKYWASMGGLWYRARNDVIVQLDGSSFGAESVSTWDKTAMKNSTGSSVGESLKLYTSADFTSALSTITVRLFYKSIYIP